MPFRLSLMLLAAGTSALLPMQQQQQLRPTVLLLTDPVLAGERDVVGGATTALTFTAVLETLPARTLPASSEGEKRHEGLAAAATDAKLASLPWAL